MIMAAHGAYEGEDDMFAESTVETAVLICRLVLGLFGLAGFALVIWAARQGAGIGRKRI